MYLYIYCAIQHTHIMHIYIYTYIYIYIYIYHLRDVVLKLLLLGGGLGHLLVAVGLARICSFYSSYVFRSMYV